MSILYLHGSGASRPTAKAQALRSAFPGVSVHEPELPYSRERLRSACPASIRGLLEDLRAGHVNLHEVLSSGLDMLSLMAGRLDLSALVVRLGKSRGVTEQDVRELETRMRSLFDDSLREAQAAFDQHSPDVIVGSSMGGALAMSMQSSDTAMVLIAPVWNKNVKPRGLFPDAPAGGAMKEAAFSAISSLLTKRVFPAGIATTIKPATLILHACNDDTISADNSFALLARSPIPADHPDSERMRQIAIALTALGYQNGNRFDPRKQRNDGRLLVIGKGHPCNEPHPEDPPAAGDPHRALARCVALLQGQDPSSL